MNFKLLSRSTVISYITVLLLTGLVSCDIILDDVSPDGGPLGKARYEDPPWLGGTSLEVLDSLGNYTTFLALMDKAEYRDPIQKQLFTMFVPNDAAFEKYFQEQGISGLDALTEDQAESIFSLHILPNARNAFQLKYEYYWSELQGPQGEYASLFYRKPTYSRVVPYTEVNQYNPDFEVGEELIIYGTEKLAPLMSKDFFEDFFGDPEGGDYLVMYPNSEWAGDLNYHNAAVTEGEVKTASGFLYFVDQVVGPMHSIEEYFRENLDQFGLFYDIAQRFSDYTKQPSSQSEDNVVRYRKGYRLIENIANEDGPEPGNPQRYKAIFSVYIPTDDVLQEYLDRTVFKYYDAIDSVPEITLYYILQTHINRSLGLKSKITNSFFNYFGDATDLSDSDFNGGYMCSNGPFYSMNKVLEPNVFTTVPRRLFFDSDYSTFLHLLEFAQLIPSISDPETPVTVFAVSNSALDEFGISYDQKDGTVSIKDVFGQKEEMNIEMLMEFLDDHIYAGVVDVENGEGFIEMNSENYVYYKDGKISAGGNNASNETPSIKESEVNDRNGILNTINGVIDARYEFGEYLLNDPECKEFANLLIQAGMLNAEKVDPITQDTIPDLTFVAEAFKWTGLVPTNDAVLDAINKGLLPLEEEHKDSLAAMLTYHFIRKDVVFDNGELSGVFDSNTIDEVTATSITYKKLTVDNNVNNLMITDGSGQEVMVDHADANKLVRRGVIHKINTFLFNQ